MDEDGATHDGLELRPLVEDDVDALVELSLRAWAPVFPSIDAVVGAPLDRLLTPDWTVAQSDAVRTLCDAKDTHVWVAVVDSAIAGFVAVAVQDRDRGLGSIEMVAVDPAYQHVGIGRTLTDHGLSVLRGWGMKVAMVETGGDGGHAPARALYEAAGFTRMPIARYFTPL
jgi:ribosomal protein S18 acetylase RimI-like enzyme